MGGYTKIREQGYYWIKIEENDNWEIALWVNKMSGCFFRVYWQDYPLNNNEIFKINENKIENYSE